MNGPAPITDDDIHAFGPRTGAAPASPARRPARNDASERPRRRWPWVLLALAALLLLTLVAILALAIPIAAGLAELARELNSGWSVTIDGRRIVLPEFGEGGWMLLALALVLVLAVVALVVPLSIGASLLGATFAVALAMIAALAVGAVVLAPLWLAAWLLWRLLRRPPPAGAAPPRGAGSGSD